MSEELTLPNKLPTIEEIYAADDLPVLYKESKLLVLLNQPPRPEWIFEHPVTGQNYIPIERIEWLLTNIFIRWRVEIKNVVMIANSVTVTVRLHCYNWLENDWLWQDGVGAAPLQTNKNSGAINWNEIKSGAVQMGAPAAESFAVKDAAEKFGKLFGKDLNRKDQIPYDKLGDRFEGKFDEEKKEA